MNGYFGTICCKNTTTFVGMDVRFFVPWRSTTARSHASKTRQSLWCILESLKTLNVKFGVGSLLFFIFGCFARGTFWIYHHISSQQSQRTPFSAVAKRTIIQSRLGYVKVVVVRSFGSVIEGESTYTLGFRCNGMCLFVCFFVNFGIDSCSSKMPCSRHESRCWGFDSFSVCRH